MTFKKVDALKLSFLQQQMGHRLIVTNVVKKYSSTISDEEKLYSTPPYEWLGLQAVLSEHSLRKISASLQTHA